MSTASLLGTETRHTLLPLQLWRLATKSAKVVRLQNKIFSRRRLHDNNPPQELAVNPNFEGKGCGRKLVETIGDCMEVHPDRWRGSVAVVVAPTKARDAPAKHGRTKTALLQKSFSLFCFLLFAHSTRSSLVFHLLCIVLPSCVWTFDIEARSEKNGVSGRYLLPALVAPRLYHSKSTCRR